MIDKEVFFYRNFLNFFKRRFSCYIEVVIFVVVVVFIKYVGVVIKGLVYVISNYEFFFYNM